MLRIVWIWVLVVVVALASLPAVAADWPSSMELAGFTITGISGSTNTDGSGRAAGRLSIWGDANCQVDLVKNGSGAITGSTRSSFNLSGIRFDGSFLLDRRGLQGTGTIHTGGKPVSDANISIDSRGGLTAQGRVYLGSGFSVPVQCGMGPGGLSVSGSSSRQSTTDTPLAVYTFRGDVEISISGNSLKSTARGTVERKGKVGGMSNTFGPMTFDVDPATGESKLNIGGATVVIDLW